MNPLIDKYLKDKYGDDYEAKSKQEYDDTVDRNNTGALFSNLGDVIAGNKVGSANDLFAKRNAQAKEDTIGRVDKDRKSYMENAQFDQSMAKGKREAEAFDPNSSQSQNLRKMMEAKFPDVAKQYGSSWGNVAAGDLDNIFKPLQLKEQIDARREQAQILAHDRSLARKDRETKDAELSATQAKQLGVYNMGAKAEEQYAKAIADKSEYDPTSSGQWIDNSEWAPNILKNNKAIEAQSAQKAWVESFLRDASGAAIAPSERMAYAKDYFPQAGDTEEVIANKANLRKQKMENALLGAGKQGQAVLDKKTQTQFPRQVRKDGKVATVSSEQELKEALADGWQ